MLKDILMLLVILELKVAKAVKVAREDKVLLVSLDLKVTKVHKVLKVSPMQLDLQAHKVAKEDKEELVVKVLQVL